MGIVSAYGVPSWWSGDDKPVAGSGSHERRIGLGGEISIDPSFNLPPKSRLKLQEIKLLAETANAPVRALSARKERARLVIAACDDEIQNLTGSLGEPRRDGRGNCLGLPADHPHALEAQAQREEAKADLATSSDACNQASKDWSAAQNLASNCEEYVNALKGKTIKPRVAAADVSLLKGETVLDGIERHRRKGRELRADAAAARAAPIHSSQAKRITVEQISALAERGAPDVLAVVEHGEQIAWPQKDYPFGFRQLDASGAQQFDALALLAWLFKPQLISAINKEIDDVADDKLALSAEQRKERLETIRRDVYEIECQEEALIMQAIENGPKISRRSDADPRAVLGLSADMPEPARFGY